MLVNWSMNWKNDFNYSSSISIFIRVLIVDASLLLYSSELLGMLAAIS